MLMSKYVGNFLLFGLVMRVTQLAMSWEMPVDITVPRNYDRRQA